MRAGEAPFYAMALVRITAGSRSSSFQPAENRAFHLNEKIHLYSKLVQTSVTINPLL